MQKKLQCTWTLVNARTQAQHFGCSRDTDDAAFLITNSGFKTFKNIIFSSGYTLESPGKG